MIVGVTGKRLSGKNEVADHLKGRHGFVILDFTQHVLGPILKDRKKPVDRFNLTNLALELRREGGPAALAKILSRKVSHGKNYVIAGIRYPEEVHYMREAFGSRFVLIAVDAPLKDRFRRIRSMNRSKDAGMSMKEFMRTESLPNEVPIPKAMRMADFTIRNTGTKRQLGKKVDDIMRRIK